VNGKISAALSGHQGKAHNWCTKTHLKYFKDGFQLYPTAETFTINYLVANLGDKARSVTSNKLERFIKEEIQKPLLVGALLSDLRASKPLLYKLVEPSEL